MTVRSKGQLLFRPARVVEQRKHESQGVHDQGRTSLLCRAAKESRCFLRLRKIAVRDVAAIDSAVFLLGEFLKEIVHPKPQLAADLPLAAIDRTVLETDRPQSAQQDATGPASEVQPARKHSGHPRDPLIHLTQVLLCHLHNRSGSRVAAEEIPFSAIGISFQILVLFSHGCTSSKM